MTIFLRAIKDNNHPEGGIARVSNDALAAIAAIDRLQVAA